MIKILLLLSLLFNITHASLIAMEDTCEHETITEYIMEQTIESECGDLCDMHHLFHFVAIISEQMVHIDTAKKHTLPLLKNTLYTPLFSEASIKPPIV
jgi:hypothetical protein